MKPRWYQHRIYTFADVLAACVLTGIGVWLVR